MIMDVFSCLFLSLQITMKKFRLISKHAAMRDVLSNTTNVRGNLHSDAYHLIGLDLRG